MTIPEDSNPYASPSPEMADPYLFEYIRNGRSISITGGLRPKYFWTIAGYTISIDSNEHFETASFAMTENFSWEFSHNGRTVEGNFRTKGFNNGVVGHFDLYVDSQYVGNFKIRLQYWWVPYVMFSIPLGVLAVALAAQAIG